MNGPLNYRVNLELKSHYTDFIEQKYGSKLGTVGTKMEKAMKLHLALEGYELYQGDPDVLELVGKVGGSLTAHTHNVSKEECASGDVVVDLVDEIKSLKAEVSQLRSEVKGKPSPRTGSLAEFKRQFKAEYGDHSQVSRRDIVRFVSDNYNVQDSRAIQNRINYLLAHNVLESYTSNVFNVKF